MYKQKIQTEWYSDIIMSSAKMTNIKIVDKHINKRNIILFFENDILATKFEDNFGKHIFSAISKCLKSKSLNEKEYDKSLIFSVTKKNITINITW